METRVRVRYSGLILFLTKIIGAFSGLAFILLVVKNLSTDDLGIWQWISKIISYMLLPSLIVNFWVTRYVARDHTNSRTGLQVNCILLFPLLATYVLLIPVMAEAVHANTLPFLLASAFVPLYYLSAAMTYIGYGTEPQHVGYSEIAFESIKVLFAFLLVFSLRLYLNGAILSIEIALAVQFLVLFILSRKYLRAGFKSDVAKQWIKNSWLSGYVSQSGTLLSLDTIVVIAVAGLQATAVLAYFSVAIIVAGLVGLATSLAGGLIPKLLKGGEVSDIEAILKLTLMFGIPMLVGTYVIAEPMVDLFTLKYSAAVAIVKILVFSVFLDLFSSLADTVLMNTVEVDKGKPKVKELAKSRLFLLPSINFMMGACYLVVLLIILTRSLSGMSISPDQIALLWVTILLVVKLPFVSFKLWFSRRVMRFRIPYKEIVRYIAGAAVMTIALVYSLRFVVYDPSFGKYFVYPLALVGTGALTYTIVMLIIDKEFRQLVKAVLRKK